MSKEELLNFFISIFPEFNRIWESKSNLFCEGDIYTSHGVCAEFSYYFKENYLEFSNEQLRMLFNKIEEIVETPKNGDQVANALYTCFLENIAQTKSGDYAKQFMGRKSKEYFSYWNQNNI